jgi:hypothetical protein
MTNIVGWVKRKLLLGDEWWGFEAGNEPESREPIAWSAENPPPPPRPGTIRTGL